MSINGRFQTYIDSDSPQIYRNTLHLHLVQFHSIGMLLMICFIGRNIPDSACTCAFLKDFKLELLLTSIFVKFQ